MSRSRSRSPRSQPATAEAWTEQHHTLYNDLLEHVPDEDEHFISHTVELLVGKGLASVSKVRNCPPSVLETLLPPPEFPLELVLINCYLQQVADASKRKDPLTMATESMAKEARNQRRRRQGRSEESSEDDEKKPFSLVDSLKVYGLQDVNLIHMMKIKEVKKHAKESRLKCQDDEPYFVGEDILKFTPQWMTTDKDKPKTLEELSYPRWVALWWSTRLTQLAAQGHSSMSTVSFATMLNEFLNVNKLAIERKHPAVAMQYDRYLWSTTQQQSESGKKDVDINELLTTVKVNEVDNLIRTTKSLMDKPSLQASLTSHVGMGHNSGANSRGRMDTMHGSRYGGKSKYGKGGGKVQDGYSPKYANPAPSDSAKDKKGKTGKGGKKGKTNH